MRTKLLRCRSDVRVQLVYPWRLEEYRQVLDALGGASAAVASGESDSVAGGSRPRNAAYVVTTAQQRHLWGLPDLTVFGRAVTLDEAWALDLFHDAALNPDKGGRAVPRPFSRGRFGLGRRYTRRFVVRRGARFPLARRARRSSRQRARRSRPSQCRSRGALGRTDRSVSARRLARRGGVGPGSGAARPAVDEVRAPTVRHGTRRAGSEPHPRRPPRRPGPHPSVPGLVSRGARPAHLRGSVLLPSRGAGRLTRPRRSPGMGSGSDLCPLSCRSPGDRQDVAGARETGEALGRKFVRVFLDGDATKGARGVVQGVRVGRHWSGAPLPKAGGPKAGKGLGQLWSVSTSGSLPAFGSVAPVVIEIPRALQSSLARSIVGRCPCRSSGRNAFEGSRASRATSSAVSSCLASSGVVVVRGRLDWCCRVPVDGARGFGAVVAFGASCWSRSVVRFFLTSARSSVYREASRS